MTATAVVNPGFENAGATQGAAFAWTTTSVAAAEEIAIYGGAGEDTPWDTFEGGWSNDGYLFALPGASPRALYGPPADPLLAESFEHGWMGTVLDLYFVELVDAIEGVFQSPVKPETFEADWGAEPYLYAFEPGDISLGPSDDFEAGWGNDTYDFTLGSATAALYGIGPAAVETFEDVYVPRVFTVDPGTDTLISLVNFALSVGDEVVLRAGEAGQLPTPFTEDPTYFVSADGALLTLRLSESNTLSPDVDISAFGFGSNTLWRDPALYWGEILAL